jgi:hypothetical protein
MVGAGNLVRSGGPSTAATVQAIAATGDHLRQLVGNLGWLDTPVPESAVLLWWAVLGGLAALALVTDPRRLLIATATLVAGIATGWVSLLTSAEAIGSFQGRYSLPFLLGVPIVLAAGAEVPATSERRVQVVLRASVWVVWNMAFYAAMRRWGAGVDGVVYPWRWADWGSPLPPTVFIVLHGLCTAVLLSCDIERAVQPATTTGILDGS